jgi:hypothetical protein
VRRGPGTDLLEVLAILLSEGFAAGLSCLIKIIPNAVIVALLAGLRGECITDTAAGLT